MSDPKLETQQSFASSEAGDPPPIHLELDSVNNQDVIVVRDPAGHIVYPSSVPQETTSPTPPTSVQDSRPPPRAQERHQDTTAAPSRDQRSKQHHPPRKVQTDPITPSTPSRPTTRQWNSEKSRAARGRRTMMRAGTTLSGLWGSSRHRDDGASSSSDEWSSSSSSSSDDEDDGPQAQGDGAPSLQSKKKPRHRRRTTDDDDQYGRFHVGNENYRTRGKVSKRDGRLSISVKDMSNTGYLAKALGIAVKKVIPTATESTSTIDQGKQQPISTIIPSLSREAQTKPAPVIPCPKLNIVIMVIGSRGDAQPFLKIGKILKETYGHRVRIATHPAFRDFVEKDSGLEFFSVGGDPSELMAFMVKNPGMIPTLETVKAGDIGRRRAAMAEMFEGFWRACINATDNEHDVRNVRMMGEKDPFVADAIIANPPSFAHIHCAEALGIPLHLMFTFPYTPTQKFPHPLASIKKSNVDPGYTNFISYPLVEMMVWQGLGDLVNEFRVKTLGLDPVSTLWAPGATYRLHVPFTYLWSPGLVPKPEDWGPEVDISGFVFLDLASRFKPGDDLAKFLEGGKSKGEDGEEKPLVYIGFGSIVVDDANRFTDMIFEAVELAGVRALVSKGWGGLGGDSLDVPEDVFLLDNTPHDWLFPKVRACVIHGGAGTTAIALKCGKPTMIVPFFGDQHFWGSMVATANAGPDPVPYKHLTAERLADGIKWCLTEEALRGAEKTARDIELEGNGAENACRAFHKNLVLGGKNSMRCSILEDHAAVWQLKDTSLRLSPMAADLAVSKGYVAWKKLRLLRHNEWNDFEGPGEPVTGVAGSLIGSVGDVFSGIGGVPYRVAKGAGKRKERKERRKRREEQKRKRREREGEGQSDTAGEGGTSTKKIEATDYANNTKDAISPAKNHEDDNKQTQEQEHSKDDDAEKDESATKIKTATSENPAFTRRDTQLTASTTGEPDNPAENIAHEVGRGAYKSASALARAPVDLSLALAQGFHNAPRLYGDDTVRRPTRVTGIRSGLRAARHEFVYGIYDGWTGVVRLPYRGAREGGVGGFVRGVGMGLTGFVLKDIAALIGPVGYTLKGVAKSVERGKDKVNKTKIRRARMAQGQREVGGLDGEERAKRERAVEEGWEIMKKLWDVLEEAEKKAGKRKRWIGRTRQGEMVRGRRGLGAAFESVRTAREALAALEKDPEWGLERVVGDDEGRNKEGGDAGKSRAEDARDDRERENMMDKKAGKKKHWWERIKGKKGGEKTATGGSGVSTPYEMADWKGKGVDRGPNPNPNGNAVRFQDRMGSSSSPSSEEKTVSSGGGRGDEEEGAGQLPEQQRQSRHEAQGIPETAALKAREEEEKGKSKEQQEKERIPSAAEASGSNSSGLKSGPNGSAQPPPATNGAKEQVKKSKANPFSAATTANGKIIGRSMDKDVAVNGNHVA